MIGSVTAHVAKRKRHPMETSTQSTRISIDPLQLPRDLPEVILVTCRSHPLGPACLLGKVIMILALTIQLAEMGNLHKTVDQLP